MAPPIPAADVSSSAVSAPVWLFAAAILSIQIGGAWDISWHISIGRDSLLSPPHLLIYLGGILAGIAASLLIFGRSREAVGVLGFRGPLGAFLAAWGGAAMLISAPFDDWWHDAYGLDVKILSPPHVVLLLGILAVQLGGLLVTLAAFNRATDPKLRRRLQWLFLFVGAIMVRSMAGSMLEMMSRNYLHTARYYLLWTWILGLGAGAVATASRHRWGATIVTGYLMVITVLFLWILPLFPAQPKLGPVFQPVTHFIPPHGFPAPVIAAGLLIDLVRQRVSGAWRTALIAGPLMITGFAALNWPFADFLLSPAARNAFFGAHYFPYFLPPGHDIARYAHTRIETDGQFWWRMAATPLAAALFLRAGLLAGEWMKSVRR
jgi:hypothetical protein